MGGKRQANILSSLISNFQTVEDVIETSMNSSGSAMAENAKWMDSIEGKSNQLTNAMQALWNETLNSDIIKGFLDLALGATKAVDAIGMLPTALAAAAVYFKVFKNIGVKELFNDLSTKVKNFHSAVQQVGQISSLNLGTTDAGALNSAAVNAYANALSGLTAKQQAAILSSQGLSKAHTAQVLAQNGVEQTTIRQILGQEALNASKQKTIAYTFEEIAAIASAAGVQLTEAATTELQKNAEEKLNAEKIESILLSKGQSTEDVNRIMTLMGLKTATDATSGAFAGLGATMKAAMMSNPLGWIITAISLLPMLISLGKKLTGVNEELIQQADELKNAYQQETDSIQGNISTLQGLEAEFNKLSSGVDDYGNNISLAADDYERYKEIVQTIVGISPSVVQGYDAEGNAIANKNGLLERSIELMQQEQRIKAQEFTSNENLTKLANANKAEEQKYKNENPLPYGDAKNEFRKAFTEASTAYQDNYELFKALSPDGYSWNDYGSSSTDAGNFVTDYYEQIVADLRSGESILKDYFTEEQITNMLNIAAEYDKNVTVYNSEIRKINSELYDVLQSVPLSESAYYELDAQMQGYLSQYIDNLEGVTTDSLIDKKQEIIDFVKFLEGNSNVQKIISEGFKLKVGKDNDDNILSYKEYKQKINEFISNINTSEYTDVQKKSIFDMLGIDTESNDFNNEIKDAVTHVTNLLKDEFDGNIENLSINDILITTRISEDSNSLTFDELRQKIQEIKDTTGIDVQSVKTYSSIVESVEMVNDVLSQTSEIVVDNTEVTQEYKDALGKLGISAEDLNKCFYENNPLVVKNSTQLRKLINQQKNARKATIEVAKAQAQLEYKELVGQISTEIKAMALESQAYGLVTDATFDNISAMRDQLQALKQTIQQYALLEISLSGAANAYEEYEKAKERDGQLTYDDSFLEMLQTIDQGILKNETGTEAFEYAVKAIVPEQFWKDIDDVDAKIKSIHDYIDGDPVFSKLFTVDEENGSLDVTADNVREFIDMAKEAGLVVGDSTDFSLSDDVEGIEDFAKGLGITEAAALALLSATEKVDAKWGNILTDVTTKPLEREVNSSVGAVDKATLAIEDFWKEAAATGKFDNQEYQKLLKQLEEANKKLEEDEQAANDNARSWSLCQSAISSYRGELKLTQEEADALARSLGFVDEKGNPTLSVNSDGTLQLTDKQMTSLLAKIGKLKEPAIMRVQLRYDEISSEIDQLQKYIDEGCVGTITIDGIVIANHADAKKKIDELTPEKKEIEYTYKITETSTEQDKSVLESYQELAKNGVAFTVTANVKDAKEGLEDVSKAQGEIKEEQEITFTSNASIFEQAIKDAADQLDRFESKTITLTVNVEKSGSYDDILNTPTKATGVRGYTMAVGNAMATGNTGLENDEDDVVVGELGPEMVVDPLRHRYYTVGNDGTEMINLPRGAIIYNHKQTKELLKNGHTTRGHYTGGISFATGNAYADYGIPSHHPNTEDSTSLANGDKVNDKWDDAASSLAQAADSLSDASDAASEFAETMDWIAVRMEEHDEKLAKLNAELENQIGSQAKNKKINQIINRNKKKLGDAEAGAEYYKNYAQQYLDKIPKKYRKKAKNGAIDIKDFTGDASEATVEAIQNYREYAQKAADLIQQQEEIESEISALAKQKFDNVAADYDYKISGLEAENDLRETNLDLQEGQLDASSSAYDSMIANSYSMLSLYEEEANKLQKMLDRQVELGNIKVDSDEWREMKQEITDVRQAAQECRVSIEDLALEKFNLVADDYEKQISDFEYANGVLEDSLDLQEGNLEASAATYDNMIGNTQQMASIYEAEADALTKMRDEQLELGNIKFGSKEWDEMTSLINDARKAAQEYRINIEDLALEKFNLITDNYDKQISKLETLNKLTETNLDLQEGNLDASKASYDSMIANAQEMLLLRKQELINLQEMLDEQIELGNIQVGSKEWDEMQQEIADVNQSIQECKTSIEDLALEKFNLVSDDYDKQISKLEKANSVIEAQIELIEQLGYKTVNASYDDMIANAEERQKKLEEEKAALIDIRDEQVALGNIEIGSAEWDEMNQAIFDIDAELIQCIADLENLSQAKFDSISKQFENERSAIENENEQLQARIDLIEASGEIASSAYYEELIANANERKASLEAEKKALQDTLDAEVAAGRIQVGSDAWYEQVNAIQDVGSEIFDCIALVEDYQNSINDIYWNQFDENISRIGYLRDETQNLIDLMSHMGEPVDDDGNFTDEAITSMGLYAQQMEIAQYESEQYAKAIEDLKTAYAEGKYSESEYLEKLNELINAQYDSIDAYHEARDAIKDMQAARIEAIKKGIDEEIDAYDELIQKKKEALDAEKKLHDFRRNSEDHQKNIADIQRKLAALANDDSAAAAAERKRLEAELAEARAEQEDFYYNHSIEAQQEALDKENENFQEQKEAEKEAWDEWLENVDAVLAESLLMVQDNSTLVYDTLKEKADEYGSTLSDSVVLPWTSAMGAIDAYDSKFTESANATTEQLKAITDAWQTLIDKMDEAAARDLESQKKKAEEEEAARKQTIEEEAKRRKEKEEAARKKRAEEEARKRKSEEEARKKKEEAKRKSEEAKKKEEEARKKKAAEDAKKKKAEEEAKKAAEKKVNTTASKNSNKNSNNKKDDKPKRTDKQYYGVALAIWNGNYGWGNGDTRKKNLKAKGFDADKVQNIVNQMGKDGYVHNGTWVGKYHGIRSLDAYHINKFAKGTLGAPKSQLALIDELGEELQLIPNGMGRLEYVKKGTGIVPADLTERLINLAMDPQEMLDKNRPAITPNKNIISTEINLDCSVGELIHIEHCDKDTLPDVEKIVNKALDKHMKTLNNNLKRYAR